MSVNYWVSTSSHDGNLSSNWSLGALASTDVLTFDNAQSTVECDCSAAWTCAGIVMTAGYTGTVNLGTYSHVNNGDLTIVSTCTFTPGTSVITFSGTVAQTITMGTKSCYDITITRVTATSTLTFSGAASLHTLTVSATNSQAVSWTGTTMTASGNIAIDSTSSPAMNFGSGITLNGASSSLHIAGIYIYWIRRYKIVGW